MRVAVVALALLAAVALPALGEQLLTLKLVARDGRFAPALLEAPAGKRFKIEIENAGKGPIEFESRELKQEKVLAAGAKSFVVINALKPGEYRFFDDFNPATGQGRIVVR